MPTTVNAITVIPARTQDPDTYVASMDTLLSQLQLFQTQVTAAGSEANANAVAALAAAVSALASQNAAAAIVNAPPWAAGNWAAGAAAWSLINGQTYRRKQGMGGASAIDPKNDPATWDPAASVPNNFVLATFIRNNFVGLK